MSNPAKQLLGLLSAILALSLSGCGTSMNSASVPPSGTIQPQSQPATGPVLGYIWDTSSQSLRPVQGLPGASILGTATISGSGRSSSFIATASSAISGTALFLDANGGVFQAPLNGGALTQIASVPGATSIILSNAGSYSLITGESSSSAGAAWVISGLPQKASVQALNLSGMPSIAGGAASDTGTIALAASSGQSGASVFAFGAQGAKVQIASMQTFGGMQFVPGSDELVVADGGTGALTAISHVSTTPSSAALSAAGTISSPVALDITPNGRWVVAANHSGDVLRVDLTGAVAATTSHCSCAPNQVQAMRGSISGTTVRLVASSGPLWIVDAASPTSRVLFIPAPISSAPAISTKGTM